MKIIKIANLFVSRICKKESYMYSKLKFRQRLICIEY